MNNFSATLLEVIGVSGNRHMDYREREKSRILECLPNDLILLIFHPTQQGLAIDGTNHQIRSSSMYYEEGDEIKSRDCRNILNTFFGVQEKTESIRIYGIAIEVPPSEFLHSDRVLKWRKHVMAIGGQNLQDEFDQEMFKIVENEGQWSKIELEQTVKGNPDYNTTLYKR